MLLIVRIKKERFLSILRGRSDCGSYYFGEILNGKPHGIGTITYPNGAEPGGGKLELVGEWKEGKIWNITRYESGEITAKWVNGVKE